MPEEPSSGTEFAASQESKLVLQSRGGNAAGEDEDGGSAQSGGAERGDHDGLLSLGRDAGYGQCPVTLFGGSASLNFDDSIMTAPTYAAVARTLRFCRLSFRFAEESVGIEVLP